MRELTRTPPALPNYRNNLAELCGGGDETGIEPSPPCKTLKTLSGPLHREIKYWIIPE